MLGYDVDVVAGKLLVDEGEAARVLAIFELYKSHQSIIKMVKDLNDWNWLMKKKVTNGRVVTGDTRFDKASLHRLLTNVTNSKPEFWGTLQILARLPLKPPEKAICRRDITRLPQETADANKAPKSIRQFF